MNKQLKRYLTITLGTCISGVALNAFFLPHHLLSGGITGLGMILYYLFGWQVSLTNILFNIPLFILAYKLMSRNYFISGIYGTLVLSFFLQLFAPLQQLTQVHDPMLSCIAGGVLHGIGLGTLYSSDWNRPCTPSPPTSSSLKSPTPSPTALTSRKILSSSATATKKSRKPSSRS